MSVRPDSDQCWHKLLIMDERQRTDSRSGKISHGRWLLVSLGCHAVLHHKKSQNLREIGPSVHDGREPANGGMGMFVLTNQTLCLVACARHGGRAGYWLVAGKTGTECIISSVVDHNLDTLAGPGRLADRQAGS